MKRAVVLTGTIALLNSAPLLAADACSVASDAQTSAAANLSRQLSDSTPLPEEQSNLTIGRIHFEQQNIFNTELESENNWLFRFANNINIMTDQDVLANVLLFKQGDKYSKEDLIESERILREQGYLYDARINAMKSCDNNEVDVVVKTRELWTLLPEISFSRSGGENRSTFGFRDSNFLGWGKRVSLVRTNDDERSGYELTYADPNVLGSRYRARLEYADNSDGERHLVSLRYPFFSLKTPYSYGFVNSSNRRLESLYDRGEEISEFSAHSTYNDIYFGLAHSPRTHWTRRMIFGYREEKDRFYEVEQTLLPIAEERALSYPYISVNWFQDEFVKVHNIDSISRTEDLNLGWQINTLFGYSSETFSDDDSRYRIQARVSRSHYLSQQSIIRWSAYIDGNLLADDFSPENLFYGSHGEYFYNSDETQSWYFKAQFDGVNGLTADRQLTLGGDSGLRGYSQHYQQGDRRALVSVEKRYYWEYNLWQLFRVGGAVFYDAGQAWFALDDQGRETHFRHDFGLGLRLAPSRANAGTVIHLDVARPINRPEDTDPIQWLVTVKKSF